MDQAVSRSTEQNAKFHAMCRDIARQMTWGGRQWNEEDWKRILLAAKFEQHVVANPLGYSVIVVNKKRSRDLTLEEMVEFIGEIEAWGILEGIKWSRNEDK